MELEIILSGQDLAFEKLVDTQIRKKVRIHNTIQCTALNFRVRILTEIIVTIKAYQLSVT